MAVQLKDICLVLIPEAPLMTLSGLAVGNNTTSSSAAAAAVNSALALGSNNSSSSMNGSTANDHDQCLISTVISSSVELWPWSPLAVATALGGWMLIVMFASVLPGGTAAGLLDRLSIRRSLAELSATRQSHMDVLDVIRVMAIIWVMINHTGSEGRLDILDRLPSAETFKTSIHEHPIFGALLGNSALGVEIFLVLSGLLAAISWLRFAEQPFWSHYAKFLAHRCLRLMPSIAVFVFIASGPLMKLLLPRYHETMIAACGYKGIAAHLTFLGNWQETPTCMGYLWYLGLDMQLYMAAPFLLQMLYKTPRRAFALASIMMIASALLRASYCLFYGKCNNSDVDIPFIYYPGQDASKITEIYAGLWEMYARPYTKCGPFLVGALLGYSIQRKLVAELSPRTSRAMLAAAATLALAIIYGILPEYWYPTQGDTIYNTLYTALFRTLFAGAVALAIAAFVFRKERVKVPLVWSMLARLTFNAYLLHMPIIYIFNHLSFLQSATTPYELLAVVPLVAVLSFLAALLFYVFVESPFGRLSNALLKAIF